MAGGGRACPARPNPTVSPPNVSAELGEKLLNPLVFQWDSGVAEVPPATVKGYEASLLIDLCNAIAVAAAAGKLGRRYARIIAQAANSTGNGTSTKTGTVPFFPITPPFFRWNSPVFPM